MRRVSFDFETHLIAPGRQLPPPVCLTWVENGGQPRIAVGSTMREVVGDWLHSQDTHIVGAEVAFDLGVAFAAWPELASAIHAAYQGDRVRDVLARQRLLDIAAGRYRGFYRRPNGQLAKIDYQLDTTIERLNGRFLDKQSPWRLRYADLEFVPLAEWPPDAVQYALDDAVATDEADTLQWIEASKRPQGLDVLADQYRQVRAAFALKLTSAWGIRTDAIGVERFANAVNARRLEVRSNLQAYGLVRQDKQIGGKNPRTEPGTRDTAAAKERMVFVCRREGKPVPLTEKGLLIVEATEKATDKDPTAVAFAREWAIRNGMVATDADSCSESEDPVLELYGELAKLTTVAAKDFPFMMQGTIVPIHTHFELCLETGRTSSAAPNIQNIRRMPGIRECFVPRPGCVFVSADYSMLELCTWAQVCKVLLGFSRMAEVLNAGGDPHLEVGATLLHLPIEVTKERYDDGDPKVSNARDAAKPLNFGLPGGMGAESYVDFARASYGIRLTLDESRSMKKTWSATWPEAKPYFRLIANMLEDPNFIGIQQLWVKRWRRKVTYTSACNTLFQGLGSDIAKAAGWLIITACYFDTSSPLYGCRPVDFVHDEWILEAPEARAHEAAVELHRLMIAAAAPFLPDVKIRSSAVVARRWSKRAKATKDANGRFIPWDISLDKAFEKLT